MKTVAFSVLMAIFSILSTTNLLAEDSRRYYIENLDSIQFYDGEFSIYYFSVWPTPFRPGDEIHIKRLRAAREGIYFLNSDIIRVDSIEAWEPQDKSLTYDSRDDERWQTTSSPNVSRDTPSSYEANR